jgi:homogentisate 1,2-dioxygenase
MAMPLDSEPCSNAVPGYLQGFGNHHDSEALPGALPIGMRAPQRLAYGLHVEQLSGTAFTAPRAHNRSTWLYRIQPSVTRGALRPMDHGLLRGAPLSDCTLPAAPLRWDPLPIPGQPADFIDGLVTIAAGGDPMLQTGCAVHQYLATRSMRDRYFQNSDGELLIVPQQGRVELFTELGRLDVVPGEIALLPRGLVFSVALPDGPSRGFVCENYGLAFTLPERGPAGSSGFASERDFLAPVAAFEDRAGEFELVVKFGGRLHAADLTHSPLDVVAWSGNHVPYKYDLARFNVLGSVSFDMPDPSIYTVLSAPSDTPGVANVDFVIFPPRWQVALDTFRAPAFHRNVMSEYLALVRGVYEARRSGFEPGGASLHNALLPHGPEPEVVAEALTRTLSPEYIDGALAVMFEARHVLMPTRHALETPALQRGYADYWRTLPRRFDPSSR